MDGISVPLFSVTLAVVAAPLALVHELGHASMAVVRLPGKVIVRVGGDKQTATFDLGRIAVRFHPIVRPWRFDAVCLFSDKATRADTVLIVLAGPAASIAAARARVRRNPIHLWNGPRHPRRRGARRTVFGLPVPCPDDPEGLTRPLDANRRCPSDPRDSFSAADIRSTPVDQGHTGPTSRSRFLNRAVLWASPCPPGVVPLGRREGEPCSVVLVPLVCVRMTTIAYLTDGK